MKLASYIPLKDRSKMKLTYDSSQIAYGNTSEFWVVEAQDGTKFVLDDVESTKEAINYIEKHKNKT